MKFTYRAKPAVGCNERPKIKVGSKYTLVQQSKAGEDSRTKAKDCSHVIRSIETANLDYRSHDCVALVARFEYRRTFLDVYVTHLIAATSG